MKQIRTLIASLAISSVLAEAQTAGSILRVELVNATAYFRSYCSVMDQGKNPNKLSRGPAPAFPTGVGIADIVSVNGQAVKGTAMESLNGTLISPIMTPGRAIADHTGAPAAAYWELTLFNPDSTLIGTIENTQTPFAFAPGIPRSPRGRAAHRGFAPVPPGAALRPAGQALQPECRERHYGNVPPFPDP